MYEVGKLPWTIGKIVIKLNLIAVVFSVLITLLLLVYTYQTVNANLQLFDKALSSMNYIEASVAETFTGRTNLAYRANQDSVFDNLVNIGSTGFYFDNPSDLINRNDRNYGDLVSYTFIVPFKARLCTTFGVFEHTVNIQFRRAVPCLRRFKD